jgi:hypothetical protein
MGYWPGGETMASLPPVATHMQKTVILMLCIFRIILNIRYIPVWTRGRGGRVTVLDTFSGLWCLTSLPAVFKLHRGDQLYWWWKLEYPEKTIDLSQITDKLYYIMLYRVHLARVKG